MSTEYSTRVMVNDLRRDNWPEAADEIERLERELSEAKKALDLTRKSISQYSEEIYWLRESNSELRVATAAMREALVGLLKNSKCECSQYMDQKSLVFGSGRKCDAHLAEAPLSTDAGRKVLDVVEAAAEYRRLNGCATAVQMSEAAYNLDKALAAMGK